ncbi:MAG: sugar phosphate nucleotidyltransferase [Eubacteriales bacterium]
MKTIIMAGGEGSRLRPITCGRPKPMAPVANRPIMLHIVELLKKHGFYNIGVTLQYKPEFIRSYFGNGSEQGVNLQYFVEEIPLGTAGSVKNARAFLDETFLVISGDALTDLNLSEAVAFHRKRGAMATLVLTRVGCPLEYGVVITKQDGIITRFLEKPAWGEVFSDTVNTGIYILEPEVLNFIPDDRSFDFSQDLFPLLLRDKKPLFGVVLPGYWCDIGNIQQYIQAHHDVLARKVNTGISAREVSPGIWMGEGVDLHAECDLEGPILIGNGCCIGAGVKISPYTTIGAGCLIQEKASVKQSVLWNNVYLGPGTALRGAVLCSRVQARSNSEVYEGAVIGSDSVLQERSIVRPEVKIWPNKQAEAGSVVNNSLIWGARWTRKLFGLEGVTGIFNIEVTAELGCRLGAAFCTVLGAESRVAVSADSYPPAQMLKEALASGMQSTGAAVYDLGTVITPLHRFAVSYLTLAGGVHVKVSQRNPEHVSILFFNAKGGNISRGVERKIENILFRDDFPRVDMAHVRFRKCVQEMTDLYVQELIKGVDVELIRKACLNLILACDQNNLQKYIAQFGKSLNITFKNLNLSGPAGGLLSWEKTIEKLPVISSMVCEEGAWGGVMIDPNADHLVLVDERGRLIQDNMLVVLTASIILKSQKGPVFVPVTAPQAVENLAGQYNGKVIRTKTAVQDLTEKVLGQDHGGIRHSGLSQFLLNFDALGALLGIISFAVQQGLSLGELVDEIPSFFVSEKEISVPWEAKGRVIRVLTDTDQETQLLDGVKVFHNDGWALVLPDPEEPVCRVFSEGSSMEIAESLADMYIKKIGEIVNGS